MINGVGMFRNSVREIINNCKYHLFLRAKTTNGGLAPTFVVLAPTFAGLAPTFAGLASTFAGLARTFACLAPTFAGLALMFADRAGWPIRIPS